MNRTDRRGSRPQSLEAARPPTALERAAGVRGAELTELGGRRQDTCRKRVFPRRRPALRSEPCWAVATFVNNLG